jgi:hypothetical protein
LDAAKKPFFCAPDRHVFFLRSVNIFIFYQGVKREKSLLTYLNRGFLGLSIFASWSPTQKTRKAPRIYANLSERKTGGGRIVRRIVVRLPRYSGA